jgi:hypothetical protein
MNTIARITAGFIFARLLLSPDRRFKLNKRSQLFIGAHNETRCVAPMPLSNEDCLPGNEGKRSMRHTRIVVTHYGWPDALRVVEEECPDPKDNEVRVSVLAAGVALSDLMMREGVHPETPPLTFTPEWDLIGVAFQCQSWNFGWSPAAHMV